MKWFVVSASRLQVNEYTVAKNPKKEGVLHKHSFWLNKVKSQGNSRIELSFMIELLFSKHLYALSIANTHNVG